MRRRYWRLLFTEDHGAGSTSVVEMQFRESAGGADVTPTPQGVAIGAQIVGGFAYANAFDENLTNLAVVTTAGGGAVGYDFGANHLAEVVEVWIKVRGDALDQCPKAFQIQRSTDGSSWTTVATHSDIPAWSSFEERVFAADTAQAASGSVEAEHTADGFLDFRNWNQADGAPAAGWTGNGSVVSNELRLTGGAQNGRHTYADRAESFRQVKVKTTTGTVNGGPTLRHSSGNGGWYVQMDGAGKGWLFHGRYTLIGTDANNDGEATGFHTPGSYQTVQMWAKNGLCKVRGLENFQLLFATSTAVDGVNGTGGMHHNNTGSIFEDDDLTCAANNIVFVVPLGYKIRVGTRVQVESSGVVTLSAFDVGASFPRATGELLDGSDNLVGVFNGAAAAGSRPAGILPGDSYTVIGVTQHHATRISSATHEQNTSAATWVIPLSGLNIAADDVILIIIMNGDGTKTMPSAPAGWNKLGHDSHGQAMRSHAIWRRADGSETSVSVVWSGSVGGVAQIQVWRNAGTPLGRVYQFANTTVHSPRVFLGRSHSDNVWLAAVGISSNPTVTSWPIGYTGTLNSVNTSGQINRVISAYKRTSTSVEDPGNFQISAGQLGYPWTICIPPAEMPVGPFRVAAKDHVVYGTGSWHNNYENISLAGLDIAAGDRIIAIIQNQNTAPNTPTGYTKIGDGFAAARYTAVFWREADGTETTLSVTWPGSVELGILHIEVWRNVGDPTVTRATATGTNWNPPSHTAPDESNIWLAIASGLNNISATAPPSRYFEHYQTAGPDGWAASSGGFTLNTAIAIRTRTATLTEDPGAFTNASSTDGNVLTIALPALSIHNLAGAVAGISSRLAHYRMYESGETIVERFGDGQQDMARFGATLGQDGLVPSDPDSKSVSFDGTDDHFRVLLPTVISTSNVEWKRSILTWVGLIKTPAVLTGSNTYAMLAPRGANGHARGFSARHNQDGAIRVRKGPGGGTFVELTSANGVLEPNKTYMVFCAAGNNGMTIHVKEIGSGDFTVPLITDNADTAAFNWTDDNNLGQYPNPRQAYIGAYKQNNGSPDDTTPNAEFFNGWMSDWMLFSNYLLDEERSALVEAVGSSGPAAPASVTVSHPSQTQNVPFMVSWSAVEGADSYEVKYSRNGGAQQTINAAFVGTSLNFTANQTGSYVFYVATNDEGETSDQTASETVTVSKKGRPSFDKVTILTAGTGNLSGEVTPGGVARGVIVGIVQDGGFADQVSAVTYGGVALARIVYVPHNAAESSAVYLYFLGSGVPAGTQTTQVTVSGATNKTAFVFTAIAGSDTVLHAWDDIVNASLSNPSAVLPLIEKTCFVGMVAFSGHNAVTDVSPLTSWIDAAEVDLGNAVAFGYRYDKVENADVTFGWTQAADDAVAVSFAVTAVASDAVLDGIAGLDSIDVLDMIGWL